MSERCLLQKKSQSATAKSLEEPALSETPAELEEEEPTVGYQISRDPNITNI